MTTFYKVDGGEYVQGDTVSLGNGDHTVRFYSVDPAGNVGPTGMLAVEGNAVSLEVGKDPLANMQLVNRRAIGGELKHLAGSVDSRGYQAGAGVNSCNRATRVSWIRGGLSRRI